jgi:hypothetical protein
MRLISAGLTTAVVLFAAASANAETLKFAASLTGADEVPANTTTGVGRVTATLDTGTKLFSYSAIYSGLTGPAVAAHFHGPAQPGSNAPPTVPMTSLSSPITGSTSLTDQQIADLEAGKWYFNVHTAEHKGGEIRGQLHSGQ